MPTIKPDNDNPQYNLRSSNNNTHKYENNYSHKIKKSQFQLDCIKIWNDQPNDTRAKPYTKTTLNTNDEENKLNHHDLSENKEPVHTSLFRLRATMFSGNISLV